MRILTVVDYDEMWPALFENERTLLQMTLGKAISRIHHIGSTSVPGLSAKPVIDILIEVANLQELDSLNQAMEGVGYTVRGENGILNRRYFTKGGNQRSHHRSRGCTCWRGPCRCGQRYHPTAPPPAKLAKPSRSSHRHADGRSDR